MRIHIVADSAARLSAAREMVEQQFIVTSEFLDKADLHDRDIAAVVVTADLRLVESISSISD